MTGSVSLRWQTKSSKYQKIRRLMCNSRYTRGLPTDVALHSECHLSAHLQCVTWEEISYSVSRRVRCSALWGGEGQSSCQQSTMFTVLSPLYLVWVLTTCLHHPFLFLRHCVREMVSVHEWMFVIICYNNNMLIIISCFCFYCSWLSLPVLLFFLSSLWDKCYCMACTWPLYVCLYDCLIINV